MNKAATYILHFTCDGFGKVNVMKIVDENFFEILNWALFTKVTLSYVSQIAENTNSFRYLPD